MDDDQSLIEALARRMYPYRHRWEMAFTISPSSAVRLLEEWEDADLILVTDWKMPGLSGVELARLASMRSRSGNQVVSEIYTILTSGNLGPGHASKVHRSFSHDSAYVHDVIDKPFNLETLLEKICVGQHALQTLRLVG